MKKGKHQIICLAGMHRSGTSLLANWLHESGVDMGSQLLGAASTNKNGHYEDMEFLDLHKKDLANKGYDVTGLIVDDKPFTLSERSIAEAREIIRRRSDNQLWGWKEPRTTLYLNHWKQLIPGLKVIAVYREPEAVVNSLYKRLKKNKWYYTRNPIKKLYWFLDIDKRPAKWYRIFTQTYDRYNQEILSFASKHPDDIIIFPLKDFIKRYDFYEQRLSSFLEESVSLVDINKIYQQEYLTQKKNRVDINIKSEVYDKLEKLHAGHFERLNGL